MQNSIYPKKTSNSQEMVYESSMTRPPQQPIPEFSSQYQFSEFPRGVINNVDTQNYSIPKPETTSGFPISALRSSYPPSDSYAQNQGGISSIPRPPSVSQPTTIIPKRPIPYYPSVIPGVRPNISGFPPRGPPMDKDLNHLLRMPIGGTEGMRSMGLPNENQDLFPRSYGNIVRCGNRPLP